jgi:hypothetical protein
MQHLEKILTQLYGSEWAVKQKTGSRKITVQRNNNPVEKFDTLQDAIDTYEGRLWGIGL